MRVPAIRHTSRAVVAGLVVTVLATAVLLGGSVAVGPWDGVYLYRDLVTVPDPVLGSNLLGGDGAPRAVPLDAVVAVLSTVLPAGLVARLLLVAPLLLVGSGVTVLLRRHGSVATAVGAGLAITNPYVAERLLLGQSPSLLGYAMIPWLVLAVRADRSRSARVLLVLAAVLPAALTPVGAVMAGVTVLVTALVLGQRSGREPLGSRLAAGCALLVPVALLSLPWVLAALQHPKAGAVPNGANAFAVGADTPLGTIGSVLSLGGVWAPGAWPDSRGSLIVVGLQLVLVGVAALSWLLLRGAADGSLARARWAPSRAAVDLTAGAFVAGVGGVLLLAGPLLPIWRTLQQVPGLALARDTHRWLAWGALAVAVLVALGVAAVVDLALGRVGGGWPVDGAGIAPAEGAGIGARGIQGAIGAGVTVSVLALGVLTVPDVPGRLARDIHPVALPPEWDVVVDVVNGDAAGADGSAGAEGSVGSEGSARTEGSAGTEASGEKVLLLPWQPFRQVDWVGPDQFLDPLPRALEPEVVHARDLLVRRDGVEWRVGGEDPALAAQFAGDVLDADLLRSQGITRVVIWLGSPGHVPEPGAGLELVHDGAAWQVWGLSP